MPVDEETRSETLTPGAPVVLLPNVVVDAEAEPVLRIEPRLRARRIELRRAARRQRRRIIVALCAVVVVLGGGIASLYSPLLSVGNIEVSGAYHLSAEQVARSSGIKRGDRMFDLDVAAARRRLSRLSWVYSVRIERQWPRSVRIRVTERSPLATVETHDGRRLVVATGGVITGAASGLDIGLPAVTVEGLVPRVGAHLEAAQAAAVEMVGVLPASIAARATAVSVNAAGEVVVGLAPRGEIWFGTPEHLDRKFSNAETLLGGGVVLDCLRRIDVRIPSAAVLSRGC